ncbi:SWI/SNF chromatin remodeling complex [Mycena indigotica]|uniref:SWI/SNF chromatin remodeling complex n=1 Tax=Mycena indigotica TaxID=2126181 RepID=A0A8H6W216_9AGAR|nr:SWI/SNF chromatin remodeling complex [Mycena indigotica]KAF7298788.1 SWI/SNF chromatin remodeling complex [Mycena indigotica]
MTDTQNPMTAQLLEQLQRAAIGVTNANIYQSTAANATAYQKLTWAPSTTSSAPTRTGSAAPQISQRQTRARARGGGTGTSTPAQINPLHLPYFPQPQVQVQVQPPPPPPPPQPSYPPPNPIPTRTQAYYSSYSSRMRTGTSLLMQPIITPGAPQAGSSTSLLTSRTSRRGGVAINYADPGSGDDIPDAGAGVDSEDSDFVNDNGEATIAPRPAGRLKTAGRTRGVASGMSVFNPSTGVTTIQPSASPLPQLLLRPEKEELDQSYLGVVPPSRFISSRNAPMTAHSYLAPHWLEKAASRTLAPVPIRVELETETHRIRDCFVWDINDDLISPESFAQIFCMDLELPSELIDTVTNQIKAQLEEHEAIARLDIINEDFDQTEGDDLAECRVILSIDVQIGNHHLVDHIEWDLLSPLTPEAFATTLCRELGLSGEAVPLVSHAVHEEILKHKKDCVEWGVVDNSGYGVRDKTGLGLGSVGRAKGGPKVLESVWRDWQEADELRTRFEVLSAEEVERREVERERASRRMRRETSKFQSARTGYGRRTRFG